MLTFALYNLLLTGSACVRIQIANSEPGIKYINNHVRLVLFYHQEEVVNKFRVVGFEVEPFRYAPCLQQAGLSCAVPILFAVALLSFPRAA